MLRWYQRERVAVVVVIGCGWDIEYYVTTPNSRKGRNKTRNLRKTVGAFA